MTINDLSTKAHENATRRKFYGDDPEKAITDKLQEELDELSKAFYCQDYKPFPNLPEDDEEFMFIFERFIKDTVGAEFAGIIITASAGAKELGIPLELFVSAVLRHNTLRRYND